MKQISMLSVCAFALMALPAGAADKTLVVTSSNAATNELLVYNTGGSLVQNVATQGAGGVGDNAGGIATAQDTLAVVNFGSQSVTLFNHGLDGFAVQQVVPSASNPVSVAFGDDHLYVLGTTTVESHRRRQSAVDVDPDGPSSRSCARMAAPHKSASSVISW